MPLDQLKFYQIEIYLKFIKFILGKLKLCQNIQINPTKCITNNVQPARQISIEYC